jgi:hypothetical protein
VPKALGTPATNRLAIRLTEVLEIELSRVLAKAKRIAGQRVLES